LKLSTLLKPALAVALLIPQLPSATAPVIQVYKTTSCGCCAKWVEHLRANGFDVKVTEVESTDPYRKKFGVPQPLASCHTALVNGYAIEGHVPAREIKRLIESKGSAKGLAVPGMPLGSPGMESTRTQAYSVMMFDAKGNSVVYQNYPAK
jgi:hypothetical protein